MRKPGPLASLRSAQKLDENFYYTDDNGIIHMDNMNTGWYKVTTSDGSLVGDCNGVYRSDENDEVRIDGLIPGRSVVVTETRAPAGFHVDTQPQTIMIQAGKSVSLTFKNQPKGKLIVQKRDSDTGDPLPGAQFRITTAAGCEVGLAYWVQLH